MANSRVKPILVLVFLGFLSGCVQIKEAGRTIGHTTRDAAIIIGHGTRDAARSIGKGVKQVVRSASEDEQ